MGRIWTPSRELVTPRRRQRGMFTVGPAFWGGTSICASGPTWNSTVSIPSSLQINRNYSFRGTFGNGVFVISVTSSSGGATGGVIYSTDFGVTWNVGFNTGTNSPYFVTYGGGLFLASTDSISSWTSTDGITWTKHTVSGITVAFGIYAFSRFYATYSSGPSYWTTTDGATYNGSYALPSLGGASSGVYNGTLLVFAQTFGACWTADGTTWTACTVPTSWSSGRYCKSLAYGNGVWVGLLATGSGNVIFYSTDGKTFTQQTTNLSSGVLMNSVIFSQGRFLLTLGGNSTPYYSSDGLTWIASTGAFASGTYTYIVPSDSTNPGKYIAWNVGNPLATIDYGYCNCDSTNPLFVPSTLLLHFDGANGSTTFTDSSANAVAMSIISGTPVLSTTQQEFGTASLYSPPGVSCQITCTLPALANSQTTSWFLDCWVYIPSFSTNCGMGYWSSGNMQFKITSSGFLQLVDSGGVALNGASALPLNTWTHILLSGAYSAGTTTLRTFINGTLDAQVSASSTQVSAPNGLFNVGRHDSAGVSGLFGYVDEYHVVTGSAITSNFTPPSIPYYR